MTGYVPQPGPIADVEVGMQVLDSNGDTVGTVATAKMGDPEAVTSEGQRMPGGEFTGTLTESVTGAEPEVAPPLAERLLRTGYIKIDVRGLFAKDVYASAEQIQDVDSGGVRLAVPRDQLIPRS